MKKLNYIILIILVSFIYNCKKQLDVKDTNEPTLLTLNTESGIKQAALGVYGYFVTSDGLYQEGGLLSENFMWWTMTNHEIMGDALFVPWGNEGWRWINRPAAITLDDGVTVVNPPTGGDQATEIARINSRVQQNDNPLKHEWYSMYVVNNMANLILSKLNTNSVTFSSGETTKRNTLVAWCYFWKGYAYSRIGSFYSAGILTNVYDETNNNFVSHQVMMDTANAYYDKTIAILNTIPSSDADYTSTLQNIIPSYFCDHVPSQAEWKRNINTLKARNILVNNSITNQDWQSILNLANDGLQDGDFIFVIVPDPRIVNFASVPYSVTDNGGYSFVSERLIQDFKDTAVDERFHRYIQALDPPLVNVRSRGIQFGTRFEFIDGTDVASSLTATVYAKPFIYIGGTFEENELMKAEANIYLGNINTGLASIDVVRDYQQSGLPAVANTGLNLAQAKEELRKERRIGLMLRGLSFYDARRWGVIDPVANGGGRKGCWVLDANGNLNTNATFDYQYLNYFPVPANETDLNPPSASSSPVTAETTF